MEKDNIKYKLLAKQEYNWTPLNRGYTDKILYINVGDGVVREKDVPPEMKEKFIGGKGYGLRLLWDATKPDTKWDDPENEIIISSGPIGGITQYSGTGKSLVVSISPQTNSVIDSNVGGFFGPFLKFSGFDALELQGKADSDIIVFIDGINHHVSLYEAGGETAYSHCLAEKLTDFFAENDSDKKNIGIVSTGVAAEHSIIGMLNFSFYDPKRKKVRQKQAGRGGIGTVFRNKRIKALVCKIPG